MFYTETKRIAGPLLDDQVAARQDRFPAVNGEKIHTRSALRRACQAEAVD